MIEAIWPDVSRRNDMKVLGISCGTRNGGNDGMCREALMAAAEQGAEVEFINVFDLDIKHCTGCTACVQAIFSGKGNPCVLKDDFDWLLDKMYDADGILFSVPIFEKGAAGIFRTITDRFGPRMDRGHSIISMKMKEDGFGKGVDPRFLQDKVVSFMGVGGSDWMTRIQCDFINMALTPMWKIIDNEVFYWSLGILADDEKIAAAHNIGTRLALAAKDIEHAEYQGDSGVCPHCHSRNFHFGKDGVVVCAACGIRGRMLIDGDAYKFEFPEEQLEHAHDTIPGKFIHANDIKENNERAMGLKMSDKYKERNQMYKDFIKGSKPER